jgi:hypothetical protein
MPPEQFGINELVPTFKTPQPQAQARELDDELIRKTVAAIKIYKNFFMFV